MKLIGPGLEGELRDGGPDGVLGPILGCIELELLDGFERRRPRVHDARTVDELPIMAIHLQRRAV